MLLPQLQSKSAVQWNVTRTIVQSGSVNELADGSFLRGGVLRPLRRTWDLEYVGLTGAEFDALAEFAYMVNKVEEGFVFVDPMANMLRQSEDLTEAAWIRSAFCDVTAIGVGDHGMAVHEVASQSAGVESLSQDVNVSGQGWLCGSCWVRTEGAASGAVIMRSGTGVWRSGFVAGPEWHRVRVSGLVTMESEPMQFTIEVIPDGTVEVRGVQLEHQACASGYKPSAEVAGIHLGSRIVDGSFVGTRQAANWFDCRFRIVAG